MSIDEQGLCSRCLIVQNIATRIVARWKAGELDHQDYPPSPTSPRALKSWAEEKLYGDNATIDLDAWSDAFRPVATWHGDPVCVIHLYQLVDRERRDWK
jgi:hypothetical protein